MEIFFRKVSVKDETPEIPRKFYVTYLENSNDEFIFEWRGHWNDDGREIKHVTHWLKEINIKALIEKLDDMDSVAMQLEDVLHGNEGKNVTSLRHGIIQIKNILR